MTFDPINIDDLPTNDRANDGGYEPLPAGWYNAHITQAEARPTKDGTGQYIKIRYDILGPTHVGRVVFANVNIRNKSAEAERIGRAQLGDLMRACGIKQLLQADQLVGGTPEIQVTVRPARDQYPASNEVKAIRAAGGAAPSLPAAAPAASKPRAAAPWGMKK
jgi:hypothetical protein